MNSIEKLWEDLVTCMSYDNGYPFASSQEQLEEVRTSLQALVDAGYFKEYSLDDLDSDLWIMAAGECTESAEWFSRAPEAYATVSRVLDEIFNGE